MPIDTEQSELDKRLNQIIAQNEGYDGIDPTPEEQEKYLSKYSFSALVCSAIYFWYMKDRTFFWVSIFSSILFFPILFFLPLSARRRAWASKKWRSFGQFQSVQKKWDEASVYAVILFVIVFSFGVYYEIKFISNAFNANGINNMNDIKQFQQDWQDTLSS